MHFTEYENAEIKVFLFWDYIGDYQAQQQEDCCLNWPNPPPLPLVHRHFFFPFSSFFSLLCMFTFVCSVQDCISFHRHVLFLRSV